MSEKNTQFLENFPENSRKIQRINNLFDSGYSYSKIPNAILNLVETHSASSPTLIVAIALATYTAKTGHYPTFSVGRSKIAKITGLSERQISKSVSFLIENKVISVRSVLGSNNQYTWNDEFLRGSEQGSLGVVNEVQGGSERGSLGGSERGAHIYIEFILDLFYKSSFKEFFAEHNKTYRFYVPAKRKSKNRNDSPQGSGETIEVSRTEAWRDAAYYVYHKIQGQNDALVRIYLSLMGAYRIDEVKFPKKALLQRVYDMGSVNESRSLSHLREFLHTDEDFKEFIDSKIRGLIQ